LLMITVEPHGFTAVVPLVSSAESAEAPVSIPRPTPKALADGVHGLIHPP
jgi:hypothetical protein